MNRDFGIVIDTNVIISSLVFGGKPRELIEEILLQRFDVYTSPQMISELLDILGKKFNFSAIELRQLEKEIISNFKIVYPTKRILKVRDVQDNKVLEVAIESGSQVIITGDEDLLILKEYKRTVILKPSEFLDFLSKIQTK